MGALAKEDRENLIILLAFGLVLRIYAFSQIYMISLDGAFQYIPVAKLFFQGEYLQALAQPQLPLYPFLISVLSHITGNFELSGQLISIIFSLLAVFPLYLIGKSLFGPRAGFWTTVLYLINPLMLHSSVDVLKEGLLIFLFFSSVYCSLRFLQEGKPTWLIWTVSLAAVGALVRMIALVVLVVLGLWLGYGILRGKLKERMSSYRYLWVFVSILGGILVFVIAVIWNWEFLTTKKVYALIRNFFIQWFGYQRLTVFRIGADIFYIIVRFAEKTYVLPFLLALFGLGWRMRAREFSAEEKYLTLLMGMFIVSFFPFLYASGRYLLPAIFLFYLWAGFGFVKIRELIDSRFTRYPKLTAVIPVMILLGVMLPISLQPQRLDKIGRKEVGLWLREQSMTPPRILTNIPRAAYYAGGQYVSFPQHVSVEKILYTGRQAKVDYLVIEEKGSEISHSLGSFAQNGELELILRHTYGREGRTIYVYRWGERG